MKIERIVLEDTYRKCDIMLLRLLHSGNPDSPEAIEMIAKNSHLVLAHNATELPIFFKNFYSKSTFWR